MSQHQAIYPVTIASTLSGAFLAGPWPHPADQPLQDDGFEVPLGSQDYLAGRASVTVPGSSVYVRITVEDVGCLPRAIAAVMPDTVKASMSVTDAVGRNEQKSWCVHFQHRWLGVGG